MKLLTCINPSVNFKLKTSGVHKGAAVALKWFLPLIKEFGGTHPPEDRVRREITTLSIGDGKGATQHFNKFPDGNCISRGAGGVQVTARKCIFIKHSSFGKESWRTFSEAFGIKAETPSAATDAMTTPPADPAIQRDTLAVSVSTPPATQGHSCLTSISPSTLCPVTVVPGTQTAASQATSVLVPVAAIPPQTALTPETMEPVTRATPPHATPITDISGAAAPQLASVATLLDDSGIGLDVESDPINRSGLIATVNGGKPKRHSDSNFSSRKRRKSSVNNRQTASYKYCICKKKQSRREEEGMVVCEKVAKMGKEKCQGNGYFHLKCLGLQRVPKDDPWYCPDCKKRQSQSRN